MTYDLLTFDPTKLGLLLYKFVIHVLQFLYRNQNEPPDSFELQNVALGFLCSGLHFAGYTGTPDHTKRNLYCSLLSYCITSLTITLTIDSYINQHEAIQILLNCKVGSLDSFLVSICTLYRQHVVPFQNLMTPNMRPQVGSTIPLLSRVIT